jgi:hypothetical protein
MLFMITMLCMITMIILKSRGSYLDDRSGGDGSRGIVIRYLSKNAKNCDKGRRCEDIIVDVLKRLDDSCYLINDIILLHRVAI